MNNNRHIILSILLLVCLAGLLSVCMLDEKTVRAISGEDGLIENLSVILWFFGFIICIVRLIRKIPGRKTLLIFWAIFCFICMGEETSWFQRFFEYSTPDVLQDFNDQEEVNLHNLNIFDGGDWMKALRNGEFDVKLILSSQNLFRLGFFLYFFIFPLLMYVKKNSILNRKFNLPVPEYSFSIMLWLVLFFSFLLALISSDSIRPAIAEMRELFYALFILIYIVLYLKPVSIYSSK